MKKPLVLLTLLAFGASLNLAHAESSGFLRAKDSRIVDGRGREIILRGMGLGGWMLQEGYMLGVKKHGTQHSIKARITDLVGREDCDRFYQLWLQNHMTRADVDLLAKAGFNSIRLPMHYNLYTLPVEAEPVKGGNTWLEAGFEMTDRLLEWCQANRMYLILDLHAAPGGQGRDANISDYDPSKPSLWESEANRQKTVALWRKLAERYAREPWIGGYDLINEPNWTFEGKDKNGREDLSNQPIWNLYKDITRAIREVDDKHMIIIEGNGWGNNYNGFPGPWDDNLVMSFHKYWNPNTPEEIAGFIALREKYQLPLWLGESGENNNQWFRECVELMEKNHIGWAWWPHKKVESASCVLTVKRPEGFKRIVDYWNGRGDRPSRDVAARGLFELAGNLKAENCRTNADVLQALISSPPVKPLSEPGAVLWTNLMETEADFTAGDGMGDLEKPDGRTALRVSQTDGTSSALRTIKIPVEAVRGKWIYLSADVKVAEISARPQDWHGVKVMLKVESPAGTEWPQVSSPAGAFDWKRLSTRILIPADATALTLHLGLELVTGTAWFDNLGITVAREVRDVPAARADQPVFKGHSLPALRGAMAHPQMKREDLRVFAEEWGGNLIRWQLLHLPKPGTEHDYEAYDRWLEKELTNLDEVLKWAKELGVMVVVDLHSPPGGRISRGNVATASGDFWGTAAAQAHFIQVWQRIATRYKDGQAVIWGFDLLNEPDDRTVTPNGIDWQTLAARTAKAIREIDPARTLIIEPAMGGSAEGFTGFEPIDLPNIVYSFHVYTPFTYTHQGVDSPVAPIPYPGQIDGKQWDKTALEASMAPAVEFARKYRVHLYVGEFSTIRWSPGAATYLADAIETFESHGWDWSYHAFREWHGWNLELGPDRNDMTPEKSPNARLKALQKWTRQNQRAK